MADHIVMFGTEDPTALSTAVTAMNVLTAAEIVAATPQPVQVIAATSTGSVAQGGVLKLYVCQTTVKFQG